MRTRFLVVCLLPLLLLTAACGGGDNSNDGVASLGDADQPTSTTSTGGRIHIDGVNPADPKFKAAQEACQQYEPRGGSGRADSGPQGPGGSR